MGFFGILYYSRPVRSAQRYHLFRPVRSAQRDSVHYFRPLRSAQRDSLLLLASQICTKGFCTSPAQSDLHTYLFFLYLSFPPTQVCTKWFFTISAQSDFHKGAVYYSCRVAFAQTEPLLYPFKQISTKGIFIKASQPNLHKSILDYSRPVCMGEDLH